jgi:predicted small lipoprotein YifL
MRLRHAMFFLALCALLAACGNKGPLVQPDQKPAQPTQDSGKQ